jgi:hypothetical protein
MFDGRGLDETGELVDDWQAGFEERAAQARQLSTRLAGLTASARSPDELVTVTVGASGDLVALELAEGVRDRPAEATAREIMATLQGARAALTASVAEVAAETVGADSATGQAVIASYATRLREPDE